MIGGFMMKHKVIAMALTFLLVFAGSFVPKTECYAAGGLSPWWNIIKKIFADDTKEEKKDTSSKKEDSEKNEDSKKVDESVDTKTPTNKGKSISSTDLSSDEMKVNVKYGALQDSLSKFVGILTTLGSFYLAFSILRSIGMSIISVAQLSTAPSYQKARYQLTKNLLTSVVCVALLGSVALLSRLILDMVF